MSGRALIAALLVVAAALIPSAPDAVISAGEPASLLPGCPSENPAQRALDLARDLRALNRNPRSHQALVPTGADTLRLCRYYATSGFGEEDEASRDRAGSLKDQATIRERELVAVLTSEFGELEPVPDGYYHCPADSGAALYAVFHYGGQPPVVVRDDLTGCLMASNGSPRRLRWMSISLQERLDRILEGRRGGPPPPERVHQRVAVDLPPPYEHFAVAKRALGSILDEDCRGLCSSWRLLQCHRESDVEVSCPFTASFPSGEVCRGVLEATAYDDGTEGLAGPGGGGPGGCPLALAAGPEMRKEMEAVEAKR